MQPSSAAYLNRILALSNADEFTEIALDLFHCQFENVLVYRKYCELVGRTNPLSLLEIPFLPIEFFKNHQILDVQKEAQTVFKSSGTTGMQRSEHHVADLNIYKTVSQHAFELSFGKLEDFVVVALLPNYLEQGESSLVYMVNHFMHQSKNDDSGFYLHDSQALLEKIRKAQAEKKSVVLFGVSYALLDLAEQHIDLNGVIVIETGGMKGRRKEMPKEALHEILRKGLNLDIVYSEYGMTELLSQAYCKNDEPFVTPPWMKILIREENDPFAFHDATSTKSGGVSVIDLANVHSCAFIHTQDLGRFEGSGFKLLGRFDHSDIRGCNQLVY